MPINKKLTLIDRYDSCPLCRCKQISPDFTYEVFETTLHWDRCSECDLTFQNPRLALESISKLYKETNYGYIRSPLYWGTAYGDYLLGDIARITQSHRRIKKIIKASGLKSGKLLDVGSASGFFGVAARKAGFEVTCVEPSDKIAELGRKKYGLSFMNSTLEKCKLDPEKYDLITIWGTDSFFLHPRDSFAQLIRALKPGGIFAMNYQDFSHWVRRFFPNIKIGWNAIYNFSDRSFDKLMVEMNLTVLRYDSFEWQSVPADHFFRIVRMPVPTWLPPVASVRIPAISFRLIVARKESFVAD